MLDSSRYNIIYGVDFIKRHDCIYMDHGYLNDVYSILHHLNAFYAR